LQHGAGRLADGPQEAEVGDRSTERCGTALKDSHGTAGAGGDPCMREADYAGANDQNFYISRVHLAIL